MNEKLQILCIHSNVNTCRSSADQEEPLAHELRPAETLNMTMSYLLHEIIDLCEKPGTNIGEWYHFLWDRTRAIRKDITQQELCCVDSVQLVEQCARFHIFCSERLCAEEVSVFDEKINTENLTKCLQTLKYMYHDLRIKGIDCPNEPEFRAYIILLNMQNMLFMWEMKDLPDWVKKSPEVKFAIQVYSALSDNNYVIFFNLVRKTTFLNACILMRYFQQVRLKGMETMIKAYCSKLTTVVPFDLYEFIHIMGFEDEEEAMHLCKKSGLEVKQTESASEILMSKRSFKLPESSIEQGRCHNVIASKRTKKNLSVATCIAGGEMPDRMYENHVPHSSFDENGYLLPESLDAKDQRIERQESSLEEYDDEDASSNTSASVSFTENSPTKPQFSLRKPTDLGKEAEKPIFSRNIFTKSQNIFASSQAPSQNIFASNLTFAKPQNMFASNSTQNLSANDQTPAASPFNATGNKNVFSQASKGNSLLKAPTAFASSIFAKKSPEKLPSIPDPREDEEKMRQDVEKRAMEEENRKKRALEEERRKKLEAKESEERRKLEEEKKRQEERDEIMKDIEKKSCEICKSVEEGVVRDICDEIVKEELERIRICETLGKNVFDSLLEDVIAEVSMEQLKEELAMLKALKDIRDRIKKRQTLRYFNIWRRLTKKRERQREALENTPVWIQPMSLAKRARSLYEPGQELVIEIMCSKKQKIQKPEPEKPRPVPIEVVAYCGLTENFKKSDTIVQPVIFWKLVISWPCLDDKIVIRIQKDIVARYLSAEGLAIDPLLKTFKPNSYETLNMCIRNVEGVPKEDELTGSNGLLFVTHASEDPKEVEKRLTMTVLGRRQLMPISLVILTFYDGSKNSIKSSIEPALTKLLESGYISKYTDMSHHAWDQQHSIQTIQSVVAWLTINNLPKPPLEMDLLKSILSNCLMEDLWLR